MQNLALEGDIRDTRQLHGTLSGDANDTRILTEAALERLDPRLVSPGLLALVGENAPSRVILCAEERVTSRAPMSRLRPDTLSVMRLVPRND